MFLEAGHTVVSVIVRESSGALALLCVGVVNQVARARKTLEVGAVPVCSSWASKTLTVLEKRCRCWAVLTGFGVGVPDLFVEAGHAVVSIIVRQTSWALTLPGVGVKDQVAWARQTLIVCAIPVSSCWASKALAVLEERSRSGAVLTGFSIGVPNLLIKASNTSISIVVRETGWASALLGVRIKNEVAWAREALEVYIIPMGASGAGKALAVLEKRGGKRAVLACLGVRVPNLFVLTSNTSISVVIGEASWALALLCVGVVNQVSWARKTLVVSAVPMGTSGAGKALAVLEERSRCWAVLASLSVGVPDLFVLAGYAVVSIVVRKTSWAYAFVR